MLLLEGGFGAGHCDEWHWRRGGNGQHDPGWLHANATANDRGGTGDLSAQSETPGAAAWLFRVPTQHGRASCLVGGAGGRRTGSSCGRNLLQNAARGIADAGNKRRAVLSVK